MKKRVASVSRRLTVAPGEAANLRPPLIQLTEIDLLEIQLRKGRVDSAARRLQEAQMDHALIDEAAQARTVSILAKYGCTGQFAIDMKTGIVTPKGELKKNG